MSVVVIDEIAHEPPQRSRRLDGRRRLLLVLGGATALVATSVIVAVSLPGRTRHGAQPLPIQPTATPSAEPIRAVINAKIPIASGSLTGVVLSPLVVWLANWDRGTVVGIDRATLRARATLHVGGPQDGPGSIAVGGGFVWVLDYSRLQLLRLDPTTGRMTGRISLVGHGEALHLAYSRGFVWVSSDGQLKPGDAQEHLLRVDPTKLVVDGTLGIPGQGPGSVLAADPRGIWVACAGDPHLTLVAPSMRVIARAQIATSQYYPRIVADGRYTWVLVGGQLERLDANARHAVAFDVPTDTNADLAGLALGPGGQPFIVTGSDVELLTAAGTWRPVAGTTGAVFVAPEDSTIWVATAKDLLHLQM